MNIIFYGNLMANFLYIMLSILLISFSSSQSYAKTKCYPYTNIEPGNVDYAEIRNKEMAGFSAAACTGYASSTLKLLKPEVFKQMKEGTSKLLYVMEKMYCPNRHISVGATGDYAKQFEEGMKVALINVMSMPKKEFKGRVAQCTKILLHYTKSLK